MWFTGFHEVEEGLNSPLQSEQMTRKLEEKSGERVWEHTAISAQLRSCLSPFPAVSHGLPRSPSQ